jgi:hypothetical protein
MSNTCLSSLIVYVPGMKFGSKMFVPGTGQPPVDDSESVASESGLVDVVVPVEIFDIMES